MGKNRSLKMVLIGLVISLFGSAIQRFSFSLYLLDISQDAAIFSNVMALSILPYIFCAPLAGSLADTKNKKHIMIVLDLLSFLVILGYVISQNYMSSHVLLTAIVMFVLSTITSFYTPAVTAMIPELVDGEELIKANALVSQVGSASNLAGPVLAGILYGIWGIRGVTMLNAISFLASAILEMCIIYEPLCKGKQKVSIRNSFVEMKESFLYLKHKRRASLKIIYSYGLYNICLVPVLTILMPFVIRTMLSVSAEGYGIVEGIVAAGMIAGTLLISLRPKKFLIQNVHQWYYLMSGAIAIMIAAVALCFDHRLVVLWTVAGFLIMMALGIGNVVTMSYTQNTVQKEYLGKISAFSTAFATATVPIGQLLFGWYIELSSSIIPLLIFVLVANLGVTLYVRQALRRIEV